MHCTAISSVMPFLRARSVPPMLRLASRAVKMTERRGVPEQLFVCRPHEAAIAPSPQSHCSVHLSPESDEGRIGCYISCSGSASVFISRQGKVIFQSIKSHAVHSQYAVELCEGDIVALRSQSCPSVDNNNRIFNGLHDAEYMAEELLEGDGTCIVGIVGRSEDNVQPPECNF